MQVFHIRGFSGIAILLAAIIAAVACLLLLPSAFMMVLWNAIVFEGSKGPEIDIYQGFLLWGAILVMLKVIFKPEIQLQFQPMKPAGKTDKAAPLNPATPPEDAPSSEETATKLEKSQNEG